MTIRTSAHFRTTTPVRNDLADRVRVLSETIDQLNERIEMLEERGRLLEAKLQTR